MKKETRESVKLPISLMNEVRKTKQKTGIPLSVLLTKAWELYKKRHDSH